MQIPVLSTLGPWLLTYHDGLSLALSVALAEAEDIVTLDFASVQCVSPLCLNTFFCTLLTDGKRTPGYLSSKLRCINLPPPDGLFGRCLENSVRYHTDQRFREAIHGLHSFFEAREEEEAAPRA